MGRRYFKKFSSKCWLFEKHSLGSKIDGVFNLGSVSLKRWLQSSSRLDIEICACNLLSCRKFVRFLSLRNQSRFQFDRRMNWWHVLVISFPWMGFSWPVWAMLLSWPLFASAVTVSSVYVHQFFVSLVAEMILSVTREIHIPGVHRWDFLSNCLDLVNYLLNSFMYFFRTAGSSISLVSISTNSSLSMGL